MLAAVQMNTVNSPLTSNLVEYLLLAMPDARLRLRLWALTEASKSGEAPAGLSTAPGEGIPVAGFTAGEVMEPTIIKWMQRIVSTQQCWEVRLSGYFGRPPEAVYLRVQDPLPFQKIAASLGPVDELIQSSGYPPARRNLRPQLCIAEAGHPNAAVQLDTQKLKMPFLASFMLEELVLLRRQFALEEYKTVQLFKLRP